MYLCDFPRVFQGGKLSCFPSERLNAKGWFLNVCIRWGVMRVCGFEGVDVERRDCFTRGRSMQYSGHAKSRWLLSLSWELKWRTQSSPVQFWWCGPWRKPLSCSPSQCVPQCHRKDKACGPYGIDIPEVSVCHLCQVLVAGWWWVPSVQKYFLCSALSWSCFWTVTRYCQDGNQVLAQVSYWVSY